MSAETVRTVENRENLPDINGVFRRWIKIRQESLFLSVLEEFSRELPFDIHPLAELMKHQPTIAPGLFSSAREKIPEDRNPEQVTEGTVPARKAFPVYGKRGYVSALFESGKSPGAVGYDPAGGTSYGIYQLSSRKGTVQEFLDYLENIRPEWAERLRRSGKADTGSTTGAFPEEWKAIASEYPEEFSEIQHSFIREKFFEPLKTKINDAFGWDIDGASEAVREALWSTAVQHGVTGAFRLVEKILSGGTPDSERDFLKKLYEARATRFGHLPDEIERAVRNRLVRERETVLYLADAESRRKGSLKITA